MPLMRLMSSNTSRTLPPAAFSSIRRTVASRMRTSFAHASDEYALKQCQEFVGKPLRIAQRRAANLLAHVGSQGGQLVKAAGPLHRQINIAADMRGNELRIAGVGQMAD